MLRAQINEYLYAQMKEAGMCVQIDQDVGLQFLKFKKDGEETSIASLPTKVSDTSAQGSQQSDHESPLEVRPSSEQVDQIYRNQCARL